MTRLGDIRYALRHMRRAPGFTLVAATMLAVGIGVNATVFTVTSAVLFKGFPLVDRNERLLYISNGGCCISYPDFEDIRAQAKSFQGMGIVHGVSLTLTAPNGYAESINATEVSAATFGVVGRRPMLGRDFTPADEIPGAAPVAILNYGFWAQRYGKDPGILGRTLRMNGAATTVIGVMPEGFSFPQTVDVWVPLVKTAAVLKRVNHDTWFAFGRLSDGVTWGNARTEVEGLIQRLEREYPPTDQGFHLGVQNFAQFFVGSNAAVLYGSMWAAVGFVLLIACANLANLLLARAIGRTREISVRIALGAGRWRIIRQLLIESLMLSAVGGFLGWWLAKWGVRGYQLAMADKSSWLILDYTMDQRVLGYLVAISIATGILFGLAPALRLSKLDVNSSLKDGSRGATGAGKGKHLSTLLVIGEMALTIVLLAGAGVMIRSFLKIHDAEIGVDTNDLLVATMALPDSKYPAEAQSGFFERLKARLAGIPGVESVAMAGSLPSWNVNHYGYELPGMPAVDEPRRPKIAGMLISPGYLRTMKAAVLSGRDFNESDGVNGPAAAIVNQRFAARFWPGEEAVGKRVRLYQGKAAGPWLTVVGVASDIIQDDVTRQKFEPLVYAPYGKSPGARWFLARTRVPTGSVAGAFRRELRALDPDLPIYGPFNLQQRLERYWDSRFYGGLFLIFAAIALLLASIGLYTVVADAASRRVPEIGIRMAIGATERDILGLVFAQGMVPLGIGLALGLAASVGVNRLLGSMLVNVSPWDVITLLTASAVLVLSAALGCLIPAWRAMRVDPAMALRHE